MRCNAHKLMTVNLCQSPAKFVHACRLLAGRTWKTVKGEKWRFDSALEKAVQCLSDLGMSQELRVEQTDAISTLISGKDLLAVLPTGFGKSLIFQMVVRIKQIMTGKLSSAIVVCPLQSIVYD